jgi:hypothetical protein
MPLDGSTLITTIGGTTSNSYVSLQELADYRDLHRLTAVGFDAAEPDDKVRALAKAAGKLDRENWQGSRATTTQRLAWPRLFVQKLDAVDAGYGESYGWIFGEVYKSDEIPQQVKDAQCELALAYLDGFGSSSSGDSGGGNQIESYSMDGLTVKYRSSSTESSSSSSELPDTVSELLSDLVRGLELRRA